PRPRVPVASRVMFGVGVVALLAAVVFWYESGGGGGGTGSTGAVGTVGSEATATPAPRTSPPPQSSTGLPTAPTAPARAAVPAPAPDRLAAPSTPTRIPAAPVAGPKTAQLRLSTPPGSPTPGRTPHRHREVKAAAEPTEVAGESVPVSPPVVNREAAPEAK